MLGLPWKPPASNTLSSAQNPSSNFEALRFEYNINTSALGAGAYGTVFNGAKRNSSPIVAVKRTPVDRHESIAKTTLREINILTTLKHKNIATILDVYHTFDFTYVIMEHCGHDLAELIRRTPREKIDVQGITFQVLEGIWYAHCNRIYHRDLKPANIMVSPDQRAVKVCDFGLSRPVQDPFSKTPEIVTLPYRAPELLICAERERHGAKVDIWSIGCIMGEMLLGKQIFIDPLDDFSELALLAKIAKVLGKRVVFGEDDFRVEDDGDGSIDRLSTLFDPLLDESAFQLLKSMLMFDPDERCTAKRALRHAYFDSIRPSDAPFRKGYHTSPEDFERMRESGNAELYRQVFAKC
ncbi:kinase-like domain-containing protein [Cladochytrium replicatum]|nr:kinase-like domain-containing protein [Cladochytrium replicatum]